LYVEFGLDYERGDLGYEQKPTYANFSHSNATIHVRVIDYNDNAPRFDRFEDNTSVKATVSSTWTRRASAIAQDVNECVVVAKAVELGAVSSVRVVGSSLVSSSFDRVGT
jgi:hypothetical protein